MTSKTDSNRRFLVPTSSILEGDRLRADYGDLDGLAESIRTQGLIHPIVITVDGKLIAGGRRLHAMRDVLKWEEVPVTYFECADETTLRILEVEENVRRKDMTWQERVCAVADIHSRQFVNSALKGSSWTQTQTGEMLGYSQAHVNYALQIASLIRKGDKDISACKNITEAIALVFKRLAEQSNKLLAKMTIPTQPAVAVADVQSDIENATVDSDGFFSSMAEPAGGVAGISDDGEMPGEVPKTSDAIVIPLSSMLLHGDSVQIVSQMLDASVDHCITDWPYGIEMDNIQQSGGGLDVSSTKAEHDVEQNEALHAAIVPQIYRVLKPGGFFITWTDIMQWQRNYDLCIAAGFKVQRWPLVWYKTSRCQNMAASYNFTKNYEIAIVCRKENATLLTPQASSVFVGSNDAEAQLLGHPFAKPYKLWEWLYSAVAQRGQTVLDPFAGRGSSTISAINYGISPLAIEVNEAHHSALIVNVSEHYRKIIKNVQFK
jgi:ParB/RepB/Spo0J family partition protein